MGPKKETGVDAKPQTHTSISEAFVVMYYEHQYERMAKLEEQRLNITNIVISISAVAFTFGFSDLANLTVINGLGLPFLMIVINAFAVAYINRSGRFIYMHRERARAILRDHASAINEYNDRIDSPPRGRLGGRTNIQAWIHRLLVFTAILPIGVYLLRVLPYPAAVIAIVAICLTVAAWIILDLYEERKLINQGKRPGVKR